MSLLRSSHTTGQPTDVAQWAERLEACLRGTDIALLQVQAPGVSLRLQRVPDGPVVHKAARPSPVRTNVQPDALADARPQVSPYPPSEGTRTDLAPPTCQVRAGSVGVLRLRHPLRTRALVQPGQLVIAGQTLALLQIGAVLLPVSAPCAGTVGQLLARDGAVVGYGEALMDIETEACDAD